MKKGIKVTLITVLCFIIAVVLVVGGYVAYMSVQYYRIADNTPVETQNAQTALLEKGKDYSLFTYNIGFGAYNRDFSFFMDTGEMKDGTKVQGKNARAQSKQIVLTNTQGAIDTARKANPDFCFFQEVDTDSTRSFHVNQRGSITAAFSGSSSAFAVNFHSAYLFYPFSEPHGAVNSGILTLSKFKTGDNIRRSYPVDPGFPTKFFDLDRCFLLTRVPVGGGKDLVLINSHMSAYDAGGTIRKKQLALLNQVIKSERDKGNYIIAGGDMNHDIAGTIQHFPSEQKVPDWVFEFSDNELTPGFHIVRPSNADSVATCRSTDMPYTKGVNYTTVIDGFIVSDNVKATSENIDTGFEFSDHNPVKLTFQLQG
jgi:endonuclease/exonuclease/phosphatase family metal-dependent hydrolase